MRDHKPIQIDIPNPCSEDWSKMTPTEHGRFCAHCQRSVIDFTGYSDAALYEFFSKHTGHVCGRMLTTQLNRDINIPPQPHSRLYRLFIGLGLTLLFTQAIPVSARVCPLAMVENPFYTPDDDKTPANSTGIKGKVFDEKKEPMIGAIVQVYQNGIVKGGAATDVDGYYYVSLQVPGIYDVRVTYSGYKSDTAQQIAVAEHTFINLDFNMVVDPKSIDQNLLITMGKMPLIIPEPIKPCSVGDTKKMIDEWDPETHTIYGDQIEKMPLR